MIQEIREVNILGGGNKRSLIGLSTDTKPITYDGGELEAGSIFTEADTGLEYIYTSGSWYKKKTNSGGSGGSGIADLSSFTTDDLTQGTTNKYITNTEKTNYENVVTEVINARNSKTDLNTRLTGIENSVTNITKIGDLTANGITETNLALAIKNDRVSLSQIPQQTYITEKAKTSDVNSALALKANQSDVSSLNKFKADKRWDTVHSNISYIGKYKFPDADFNIFPITIMTDGYSFYTDFDVSKYKNTGGTTYYFSPSGNDTNNGLTETTPKKSIASISSSMADGDTIILLDGIYSRQCWFSSVIEKSVNIIAKNDGQVIVKMGDNHTYTVNATYSNVYQTPRTSPSKIIQIINDITAEITSVTSLADCSNAEGTYYYDGTNIYLHLFGGVVPTNNNCIITLLTGNPLIKTLCASENVNLYLEGIKFIGGNPATVWFSNSATYLNPKLYAKNCTFSYAKDPDNGKDAVSILGATAYFQNCEASFSNKDGFNYHAYNGALAYGLEINCVGKCNGKSGNGLFQNGSTAHDGCKVIRLNSTYFNNYGGNVTDVMDNTKSLNLGCVAFNSMAGSADPSDADFVTQQSGATMWLDNCKAFGSAWSIYSITGSAINVHNCNYETTMGGGTITIG